MTARDQPARRVDGDATVDSQIAGSGQRGTIAGGHETETLDELELRRRSGVVHLDDVDIVGADPGPLEGDAHRKLDGCEVIVEWLGSSRRRGDPEDPRPIHVEASRRIVAHQQGHGGAVGDRRAHRTRQRVDDHPGGQHLVGVELATDLGDRVHRPVPEILGCDRGEVRAVAPLRAMYARLPR